MRGVVRPGCHLLVNWLQRRRPHTNNDLAVLRLRLRKFLTPRSLTNGMEHCCIHGDLPMKRSAGVPPAVAGASSPPHPTILRPIIDRGRPVLTGEERPFRAAMSA